MMSAYSWMRFGLKIVFVYLYITPSHYHHYANISEDIENACQIYFVECVRLSIFSQLSIMISVGLFIFSLSISLAMIEIIYILCLIIIINRKYELLPIV